MKTFLLILLLSITVIAKNNNQNNPVVYAALGDNIYNNLSAIAELKNLKEFKVYSDKIISYVDDAKKAKEMGFAIEEGDKTLAKSDYLNKLRVLSKLNDFFVNTVRNNFKHSLKNENSKLFVSSVDSGLLDIKRYKKRIRTYYYKHENDIDEYGGILSSLINADESKKVKKKVYRGKSKKDIQDEKMRRIRQKDKDKQKAIQKTLEDELVKKKAKIRKNQKKELESTTK